MKKLIFTLSLLFGFGTFALGQTALTQTTLSAAVTSGSTRVLSLTSATNVVANQALFITDGTSDNAELVEVNSVSGTAVSVTRGYNGTKANAHISGALVFVGNTSLPSQGFFAVDPSGSAPFGTGTNANTASCANSPSTPYINYKNGKQWLCSTVSLSWVPGFFNTDPSAGVTTAVASAAGQVTPSGPLFHITGTAAITGFTSGVGMGGLAASKIGAPFCIIPDGIFTTTATNNIALASTAVVNKLLCYTYDQTNSKYVPTY